MIREAIEYGVAIIQIRTLNISNLCPSLFRTLSRDETFFNHLKLLFPSRYMFRKRNDNTDFATLTVTCVCVSQTRLLTYSRILRCSVLQLIHLLLSIILREINFPVLQDIAFIHDAVVVFLHVRVFCVCTGVFRA
jgi:hypothetical protein